MPSRIFDIKVETPAPKKVEKSVLKKLPSNSLKATNRLATPPTAHPPSVA